MSSPPPPPPPRIRTKEEKKMRRNDLGTSVRSMIEEEEKPEDSGIKPTKEESGLVIIDAAHKEVYSGKPGMSRTIRR